MAPPDQVFKGPFRPEWDVFGEDLERQIGMVSPRAYRAAWTRIRTPQNENEAAGKGRFNQEPPPLALNQNEAPRPHSAEGLDR